MASKKPNTRSRSAESHATVETVGNAAKRQKVEVMPREADILFYGDANLTCHHAGNLSFVQCVKRCLHQYCESDDMGKLTLCNGIVEGFAARLPPARFLMRDNISRDWVMLSKADAIVVTAHAFIALLFQEERTRTEAQQIDAMFYEEFTSDQSQEATRAGSPTFGSEDEENADRSNDILTDDLATSTTTEVHVDSEVDDIVTNDSHTEVKLSPRKHSRCVSMDFETIHLPEVDHDFMKQLPLLRQISETSQSDIVEPISDSEDLDDVYWDVMNNNDFEELKYVLDCDEQGIIS